MVCAERIPDLSEFYDLIADETIDGDPWMRHLLSRWWDASYHLLVSCKPCIAGYDLVPLGDHVLYYVTHIRPTIANPGDELSIILQAMDVRGGWIVVNKVSGEDLIENLYISHVPKRLTEPLDDGLFLF